ncbi:hypothetical protein [Noviherbaspirillum sp.]|mgnify:CR=1 FL=1|uniref:hypothetical protein n=1 Tax=Noviherbaspirillum sp. TaxID=1926288 RepID=UPI002FE247B2
MASSTLDPDNIPEPDRQLGTGHGADALGPSDTSDTGSDVQGGLRAVEEEVLPLDRGTTEDPDSHNIDVSSEGIDSAGTGESSTAGRNSDVELARDIGVDRIDSIATDDADFPEFDTDIPPPARQDDRPPQRR